MGGQDVFRVVERRGAIVGLSPLHTIFGAMNVERRSLLTRARLAGMHFLEVSSTLTASDEEKSVLWLHSVHHHQSSMRVTGTYKDPLDRQIMERIQIQNFKGPVSMNRRSEMGGVRVDRMQYRRWGGNN